MAEGKINEQKTGSWKRKINQPGVGLFIFVVVVVCFFRRCMRG